MRKEFVMRGKIPSGTDEVLNFSGKNKGYAYRMTEFQIYPSTNIGGANHELAATVTAAKTHEDPSSPNFNNEGLIASAYTTGPNDAYSGNQQTIVDDTFLITQDLIIAVIDTVAGSPMDVNYQCRFESVKMTGPEEAATNYKQFTISDA